MTVNGVRVPELAILRTPLSIRSQMCDDFEEIEVLMDIYDRKMSKMAQNQP